MRAAFTLIELLVVITIIGLISVIVLPGLVWTLTDRQVLTSAQLLHGALVGARDAAIGANAQCGIRLLPSAVNPDSLVQIMPLITPPTYSEGLISTYPGTDYSSLTSLPCLVVEQSPGTWVQTGITWAFLPNSPTNWSYNVRLGDHISWGGKPYTVCGPTATANNDLSVNGQPWQRTYTAPDGITQMTTTAEYLFLVNGVDDGQSIRALAWAAALGKVLHPTDGYIDNGWDGVDNDLNGIKDLQDPDEWETEQWTGPLVSNVPYMIVRRPIPGLPQSAVTLSVGVSLSASTLLVNPLSGTVDLMIRPDGTVDLSGPYAAPSAVRMAQAKSVFVLQDSSGNQRSVTLWTQTGQVESQ